MPRLGLVGRTAGFNIGTALISALTGILLARWLGPTDRGHYAAIAAYFGVVVVVSELGIASSLVYFVSRDKRGADTYVRTATRIFVPLGAISILTTAGFALLVLSHGDPLRNPLLVLTAAIAVTLIGAPPNFALQALSISSWNIARLTQPAVMLVLVVVFGALSSLNVPLVIWLLTGALAFQSVVAWCLYLRHREVRGRFSSPAVRPMVRFGLANVASTAPNVFNARLDQLILAFFVSAASLGQYAVAVSLSLLAGPLALAFGNVAFPQLAGGGDPDATITRAIRGSFWITGAGVIAITAVSPIVVPVVFGDGYERVPLLLFVLAPGAVFFVVNSVIGDLLRGLGRPGMVAVCEWTGLIGTVVGLLICVQAFGAIGAAFTSSAVYLAVHLMLRFSLRSVRRDRLRGAGPTMRHSYTTTPPGIKDEERKN